MKKILYICTKPIENWDIFTPPVSGDLTQSTISLLLLHEDQHLENVPVSQVWNLNRGEQQNGDVDNPTNISYQEFLEQVFAHDLSVII